MPKKPPAKASSEPNSRISRFRKKPGAEPAKKKTSQTAGGQQSHLSLEQFYFDNRFDSCW